jgi:hypothetical protein
MVAAVGLGELRPGTALCKFPGAHATGILFRQYALPWRASPRKEIVISAHCSATVAHPRRARDRPLKRWALEVQARTNHNKAACALANKLAREPMPLTGSASFHCGVGRLITMEK